MPDSSIISPERDATPPLVPLSLNPPDSRPPTVQVPNPGYFSVNAISSMIRTGTGLPSFLPGSNCH
jgi:hypothetical protein